MSGRMVTLIDDDLDTLQSFQFWLELEGHKVAAYPSALAFLADLKSAPACLIVDHHMAGMTGLELAEHLRVTGRSIPFLLLTGAPSPSIATAAARIGIAGVLEKPPAGHDVLKFIAAYT